ncbi:hypothetical protein [Micromonospora sp. C31]|uniref:response regulator transcription factor n=1 Tax=Micromonospora sp. C31 TaxID=2824876 RepID=UPI0027DE973B|nr:hypothetical protein [Micromonospora sp. C31]
MREAGARRGAGRLVRLPRAMVLDLLIGVAVSTSWRRRSPRTWAATGAATFPPTCSPSGFGAIRAGASGFLLMDTGPDAVERRDRAVLHISPATARTYVSRLLAKLHARDRSQLVVAAYESGLVRPGSPPTPD